MNDPIYQIFRIHQKFHRPLKPDENKESTYGPKWFEGLEPGRIWNSYSYYYMPKENVTLEAAERHAEKFFQEWLLHQDNHEQFSAEPINVQYLLSESWCMGWFSHWTWDMGQDDRAILMSFHSYINRMQDRNYKEGKHHPEYGWKDKYVLMGAEERWRWRGQNDTPAPCRCDGCKKLGVVRIDH